MAKFENKDLQTDNLVDKLVSINRVSKTVKGGRTMSFSALVVVGDRAGKVGFGKGHAREVQAAVQKATKEAKRKLIQVPLREGRTLHHDVSSKFGAGSVIMRSAVPGTGIIAGGALRAVFDCLGVQDVVAKSSGSHNPNNMVRAAFLAFRKMNSPKTVALRRGKQVTEIIANRDGRKNSEKEVVEKESNE
jgi:small subunit ribosomal protein S5